MRREGDFDRLLGRAVAGGHATVSSAEGLAVGLLLLVAAAGKSALVPFSGWLPRAMEGPTPSSAVFYGALSVHLGAFLLLRVGPTPRCVARLLGNRRRLGPADRRLRLPRRRACRRTSSPPCRSPRWRRSA